ncbi:MAG: CHAD domain-containing protein [Actinomycetota bacterium]
MATRVADVVRKAITGSVARLAAHEDGLRRGDDPEDVHQARVATRRLRSDLRTFGDFVDPEWADELRAELRWLGAELGAVRDIEVMRDRLRAHATRLPDTEHEAADRVVRRLIADWDAARSELTAALSTPRFRALRERLDIAAHTPKLSPAADAPARTALRRVVRKPWKKLASAVATLGAHPPDEALHAVRIRAKRCRYAAEATAVVFGKDTARFARAVARVQDVLGEHQDAVVARAWLAKTAEQCPANEAFAAGMLAQVEVETADEARRQFPEAWKKVRARTPKW